MESTLKRFHVTSSSLLGLQLLSGCGAPAAQTTTALPTPGASALPIASPASINSAANATTPTAATATPSPFHIVATGSNMQLIPSGDDLLLFDGIQTLAKVEGDRIVDHPEYLAAYPGTLSIWEGISQVGGKWPDAGWIEVTRAAARTSYSILYEKDGNQWRKIDQTQEAEGYGGIQEWDRGRRIALVSRIFEPSYYWEIVRGTPRIPPKPKKFNACTTGKCGDSTATGIVPSDFAALPTGHLFAVGAFHNEENNSGWAVERWEPNHVKSKVDILPTPSDPTLQPMVEGITAFAPDDAYVFGKLDRFIEGPAHMPE